MNVIDEYKNLEVDEIKSRMTNNGFIVAMTHIEGDFNFGNVVRSANAFGAEEVWYIGGKKKWDKRSAVGTYNYTKLRHFKTTEEVFY